DVGPGPEARGDALRRRGCSARRRGAPRPGGGLVTRPAGTDARVGTTLGAYRIEAVVGRGGMGTVYLAEQQQLKRKVALKVLAPELADDERFRARFHRESQLAASIDHPNIVPIYEAGELEGALFFAMRFVEGMDLDDLVEGEAPLDPVRTASIISQAANALDAAHAKGLVH